MISVTIIVVTIRHDHIIAWVYWKITPQNSMCLQQRGMIFPKFENKALPHRNKTKRNKAIVTFAYGHMSRWFQLIVWDYFWVVMPSLTTNINSWNFQPRPKKLLEKLIKRKSNNFWVIIRFFNKNFLSFFLLEKL